MQWNPGISLVRDIYRVHEITHTPLCKRSVLTNKMYTIDKAKQKQLQNTNIIKTKLTSHSTSFFISKSFLNENTIWI